MRQKGFTLIELMVTVMIIGILASVALPNYRTYIQRSEITEAMSIVSGIRDAVAAHYVDQLDFPANNALAGVPAPDKLIGNRVTGVTVADGAIHVTLGNKASKPLQGKVLSFRPAVVDGSPSSPIAWLCGYDGPVSGMSAVGDNRTDVPATLLPTNCRQR
ncbi:pilin [Marinobacter xestospongiae]|uniref:Pilin n=1 Tax=Marinobacter xestospongiae TaxID=994319 RepID=A0ABU3W0T5_9GAMM|nr:pilin [Marinobacter xestospongiae]MDV2080124.1 pilin [Marinobacter xestospongiae]